MRLNLENILFSFTGAVTGLVAVTWLTQGNPGPMVDFNRADFAERFVPAGGEATALYTATILHHCDGFGQEIRSFYAWHRVSGTEENAILSVKPTYRWEVEPILLPLGVEDIHPITSQVPPQIREPDKWAFRPYNTCRGPLGWWSETQFAPPVIFNVFIPKGVE